MGSRIMHAIIGSKLADRLQIENKAAFLFGNIAPDAAFLSGGKTASHFWIGEHDNFTREIDYHGFLQKYRSQAENEYILGYYTHLIADDLWLKGFYQPWLKNRMEADEDLHKLYHQDFHVLNGQLLDYYGMSNDLRERLHISPELIDLEEVKITDLEKFIPYLLEDMEYTREVIDTKLNVFSFQQILGYMETAVNKSMYHVTSKQA